MRGSEPPNARLRTDLKKLDVLVEGFDDLVEPSLLVNSEGSRESIRNSEHFLATGSGICLALISDKLQRKEE
jgi:hypothetical protein